MTETLMLACLTRKVVAELFGLKSYQMPNLGVSSYKVSSSQYVFEAEHQLCRFRPRNSYRGKCVEYHLDWKCANLVLKDYRTIPPQRANVIVEVFLQVLDHEILDSEIERRVFFLELEEEDSN